MSVDYKYSICRKADDKKIATFYYNAIKSLYDIPKLQCTLKLDPENINSEENNVCYDIDDINSDIEKLKNHIKILNFKVFEKKMMIPATINLDVKCCIEDDIVSYDHEIEDCMYAIEALAGLKAVVNAFVEDAVKDDDTQEETYSESHVAYVYNAKGLPKTKEGYDPHLWASDVYLKVQAYY